MWLSVRAFAWHVQSPDLDSQHHNKQAQKRDSHLEIHTWDSVIPEKDGLEACE